MVSVPIYSPSLLFRINSSLVVRGFGVTLWEIFSFAEMPYGDLSGQEVCDAENSFLILILQTLIVTSTRW